MPETWFAPIRAYCERTDATFWAEPANAVSNVAFLVAACAVLRREGRQTPPDPFVRTLAGLVAVVGLGSFLFHTLAVRWSLLADVIPIAMFIHAYFFLVLRRFFGLGFASALAATALFAGFGFGLEPLLDAVTGLDLDAATNGSLGYVPAILALLGVGVSLLLSKDEARRDGRRSTGRALLALAVLFGLSLSLRTLDQALCTDLPSGTHFLWHVLNAAVLFGLLTTALRDRTRD